MQGTQALKFTYDDLRLACLELFLSVKIRSDEEIDNYNKEMFLREKQQHADVDGYALIDMIKTSVEALMNMKMDDQAADEGHPHKNNRYGDSADNVDALDSIEVDLPEGARVGLKDASQDMNLDTALMNEQLKKSLPLGGAKVSRKQEVKPSQSNIHIENQKNSNQPSVEMENVEGSNVFSPVLSRKDKRAGGVQHTGTNQS